MEEPEIPRRPPTLPLSAVRSARSSPAAIDPGVFGGAHGMGLRAAVRGLALVLATCAVAADPVFAWTGREASSAAERSTSQTSAPRPSAARLLEPLGSYGRSAQFSDPVLFELARDPRYAPQEGAELRSADGRAASWKSVVLGENGELEGDARSGSWLYVRYESEGEDLWLLESPGAALLYANGEPRMGDIYRLGLIRAPIALHAGVNDLFVRVGRGAPTLKWSRPRSETYLESFDRTLPDVIVGQPRSQPRREPGSQPEGQAGSLVAAVLATNASNAPRMGWTLTATCARKSADGTRAQPSEPMATELPTLAALETRKIAFEFFAPSVVEGDSVQVELVLRDAAGAERDRDAFELAVRKASQHHARTFRSAIDDSVQYYAVAPPSRPSGESSGQLPGSSTSSAPGSSTGQTTGQPTASSEQLALILSLHGASVEASGQAAAYTQKPWCALVAPTNRRPYGFDWEDWGRRDALEVLDLALSGGAVLDENGSPLSFDSTRVYLTGHSMGGHGTWQIGARYAERFAAIAPSAGWSDFWSYMGADAAPPSDPIGAMLHRASNGSRTLLWAPNYAKSGVYVLHGDADDNVPVSEARRMREELGKFHPDFTYFEQPGANHWWGNECVDWPPLMEFLERHGGKERESATEAHLRLVDLDAARTSGFATLLAQSHSLELSELHARAIPSENRFEVTTVNVDAFALTLSRNAHPDGLPRWSTWQDGQSATLVVDGATIELPADQRTDGWTLRRDHGEWQLGGWPGSRKLPGACGPFKAAFDQRFVLVYGTAGDAEENAWALAKTRFDADQFRYRGNASPLVVSDDECLAKLGVALGDRGLVLYGNADTNRAWKRLVDPSALQLGRGAVRLGERTFEGDDLVVLAVRPRADRTDRQVALVGGSGVLGMRATNHAPYFVSGAGFPDWWIARAPFLRDGLPEHVGAGFFHSDWSLGPNSGDDSDTTLRVR